MHLVRLKYQLSNEFSAKRTWPKMEINVEIEYLFFLFIKYFYYV